MSDDPFAFQVQRLTHRHRERHPARTVAEVTLQRWLTLRRRYSDPFDSDLFDQIDAALLRMPASVDVAAGQDAEPGHVASATVLARRHRGRSGVERPISWSA